jgi:cysteine synthase A
VVTSVPTNIADHVGGTPMVELARLAPADVRLFGKLEAANPGGSVKDRIGVAMIEAASARACCASTARGSRSSSRSAG